MWKKKLWSPCLFVHNLNFLNCNSFFRQRDLFDEYSETSSEDDSYIDLGKKNASKK